MYADALSALSAYKKADALPNEIQPIGGAESVGANSFSSVLQQVAGDTVDQLKKAEDMSRKGVLGKASPVEIATAVAGAETTLQMLTVLREKVLQAYQEVSRMSV
jgi:flagellar hook-basal body complex protein FliE